MSREVEAVKAAFERSSAATAAAERHAGELSRQLADTQSRLRACEGERTHLSELLTQAQARMSHSGVDSEELRLELVRAREDVAVARADSAAATSRLQEAEWGQIDQMRTLFVQLDRTREAATHSPAE